MNLVEAAACRAFALVLAVGIPTIAYAACPTGITGWGNICPHDAAKSYCDNVGKIAHNRFGPPLMRTVQVGKIIGVWWRPKGSLISAPGSQYDRTSPRDAFYYVIDDGAGPECAFLRQAREISAK